MTDAGKNARPTLFANAQVVDPSQGLDKRASVLVEDGIVTGISEGVTGAPLGTVIVDCAGKHLFPGLIDARVYVGEPGGEHRETIASASKAAAAGGVTGFIMMPETDPVIDDVALVDFVMRAARDTALVHVHPSVAITKGFAGQELTEFGLLQAAGAVMLTEGRHSLRNNLTLRRAMTYARDFGLTIACETRDRDLSSGGVMNEGANATLLGLPGVPAEAETIPLQRDLALAALTKASYHAAAVSTAASVQAIREARQRGVKVSAGVSINHLCLNENDIGRYRTFFRLSPPLRSEEERAALVEAVANGDVDLIVSCHDPQDVDTKRLPFAEAAEGAIGLETLFAAALRLVHNGDLTLPRLIDCLSCAPARQFGLPGGTLRQGSRADLFVADLDMPWVYGANEIISRSRNTPFEGAKFNGRVLQTMVAGKLVFSLD